MVDIPAFEAQTDGVASLKDGGKTHTVLSWGYGGAYATVRDEDGSTQDVERATINPEMVTTNTAAVHYLPWVPATSDRGCNVPTAAVTLVCAVTKEPRFDPMVHRANALCGSCGFGTVRGVLVGCGWCNVVHHPTCLGRTDASTDDAQHEFMCPECLKEDFIPALNKLEEGAGEEGEGEGEGEGKRIDELIVAGANLALFGITEGVDENAQTPVTVWEMSCGKTHVERDPKTVTMKVTLYPKEGLLYFSIEDHTTEKIPGQTKQGFKIDACMCTTLHVGDADDDDGGKRTVTVSGASVRYVATFYKPNGAAKQPTPVKTPPTKLPTIQQCPTFTFVVKKMQWDLRYSRMLTSNPRLQRRDVRALPKKLPTSYADPKLSALCALRDQKLAAADGQKPWLHDFEHSMAQSGAANARNATRRGVAPRAALPFGVWEVPLTCGKCGAKTTMSAAGQRVSSGTAHFECSDCSNVDHIPDIRARAQQRKQQQVAPAAGGAETKDGCELAAAPESGDAL